MAWTAPMTATDNTAWTAAQFNTHVRDNLLETMPGKATAAGRFFVASAANTIAERVPTAATVATSQTTTSTSFTNLTTPGPAVTVTTGTRAIVFWGAAMSNSGANQASRASVAVSGATTIAASTTYEIHVDGTQATSPWRMATFWVPTLTAGSNTFTMQYSVGSGTGTFADRYIYVIPL